MIEVLVSEDGMTAEIVVSPEPEEELTVEMINANLNLEGVQEGIDEAAVARLLREKIYGTPVQVAKGTPPINGEDGYYVYLFDIDAGDGLPRVRDDGTVDYSKVIANVNEGDLLVEYHPETAGTPGINIFGKTLEPVRGKVSAPLRCKNARLDENLYFSELKGHVSLKDNELVVNNVLEIEGDADYNIGDIRFNGDIHVLGDVTGGVTLRAEGSVLVDGVIEDAKVFADQDIIVNRGIHGQGTRKDGVLMEEGHTMVEAKGNLRLRFIDHGFAKADGDVYVDYAIGSVIEAEGKVIAKGRKGIIVGGSATGFHGVEANRLGNDVGLPTEIHAGFSKKVHEESLSCRQRVKNIETELEENPNSLKARELREKLPGLKEKLQDLEEEMWQRQASPVVVYYTIYENVKLKLGGTPIPDMSDKSKVEIRKINGNILCQEIGSFSKMLLQRKSPIVRKEKPKHEKSKLLVIDDDARFLRTMHQFLEERYQVAVATSGRVARKYLETNDVELIMLDYMMPDENGVEVLKSFREWDKVKDVPVVFLTGLDDKKKILECLSLHPAGYIMKPVEKDKLFAKVHAILGEKED